mgnify:CR=1 FL=1
MQVGDGELPSLPALPSGHADAEADGLSALLVGTQDDLA